MSSQGIANSPGLRINVSQSLAYARAARSDQSPTASEVPTSTDASNVSLTSSEGPEVASGIRVNVPASVAKGYYEKQQAVGYPTAAVTVAKESSTPVTNPFLPNQPSLSSADAGPSHSQRSVSSQDDGYDEYAPPVDRSSELIPLATKYVELFQGQIGSALSEEAKAVKIIDVAKFYSAPSREGRLAALVEGF